MRLIDANALLADIQQKAESGFPANKHMSIYAESCVVHAPTVDAVAVVRCKDCKHADKKTRGEASVYTEECLICTEWPTIRRPVMPDGFCNYGKRRVEDAVN